MTLTSKIASHNDLCSHSNLYFSFYFIYFLLFVEVYSSVNPSSVQILVPPQSLNVSLYTDVVTVTCKVKAEGVSFIVNGLNADHTSNQEIGFQSGTVNETEPGVLEQTLAIRVSTLVDNSSIVCSAFNIFDQMLPVNSEPAIIRVQGALTKPRNFEYNINSDDDSLEITWTPPPTLLGTSIQGYNITLNQIKYDFTENTKVLVNVSDFSPCNVLEIIVSAYNGLNGEVSELITLHIPSTSLNDVSIPVNYTKDSFDDKIVILVNFNVSKLCDVEKPSSVLLTVQNNMTGAIDLREEFYLTPLELNAEILIFNDTITLDIDQDYIITIEFLNTVGILIEIRNATIFIYSAVPPTIESTPITISPTASPNPSNFGMPMKSTESMEALLCVIAIAITLLM